MPFNLIAGKTIPRSADMANNSWYCLLTRRAILGLGSMAAGGVTVFAQVPPGSRRELGPGVLSKFGSAARESLLTIVSDSSFRGQIRAAAVRDLMRTDGKSAEELMLSLLPLARTGARPPLSNFLVGAVVQGSAGNLYLGANIEVPGHALGLTVHAEQAALANAYMHGENGVTSIAVTAPPCGHCRQFLNEMSLEGDILVLLNDTPPARLSALLPMAFGPKDLGFKQGALPVKETALSLAVRSGDALTKGALEAARKSYSPYTGSLSGLAIVTSQRRMFTGSYIENAAFNPSLSPLQTALAGLFAAGLNATSIVKAVLVEVEGARISQSNVTLAALRSLAPAAKFEIVRAKRSG